jgi:hypothetical protein
MTKVEWLGIKAEIQTELNKAAEEAAPLAGLSKGASPDELQRAVKVAEIARQGDIALVRQQVDSLATEYENIRAAMPPGDPRTRRMEVVVSKMRTIGRAAFPIRYELTGGRLSRLSGRCLGTSARLVAACAMATGRYSHVQRCSAVGDPLSG